MPIYLINAAVYRGSGRFDENSGVVLAGGKIRSIGAVTVPQKTKKAHFELLHQAYRQWLSGPVSEPGKRPTPPELGDLVIDCKGLRIYPGMIDPHTHVAVWEEGAGPMGPQANESSDPNTAQLDIRDSLFPEDMAVTDAIAAGVTTCCILPGSGNLIGGTVCVAKMYGRTVDEMIIVERQGLKMALGENPLRVYGSQNKFPKTRFGNAGGVRDAFDEALHYSQKYKAWLKKTKAEREKDPWKRSRKLENIAAAINGDYPVRYHAHRTDDIYTAIRLSREFGFRLILEHGTEGYKIPDVIAKEGVPITLGPTLTARSKYELRGRTTATAAALHQAGVLFGFQTDHPVLPIYMLPVSASIAVKDGLPEEAAVDALTINSAKILGLDSRIGSLAPRKDADLFVSDGDVLDPRHHVLATFIDGFCVFVR
jgi:imidazolonepropionase-like amidohydrolase